METQTPQDRKRNLRKNLGKIARGITIYPLAFEGATRIAEAYLPPQYAEMARNVRYGGETILACGGMLSAVLGLGCFFNPIGWMALAACKYSLEEREEPRRSY